MAPFLAMTSWQTFRRPSAQAAATRRACCERQMARTRALNAVFPKAGRPRPKNDIGGCVGCTALERAQKCFIVAQHEPRPVFFHRVQTTNRPCQPAPQNSRTQGGQRGLGGEGLDDTTTSRYMCTQPFCNKDGFIQNRLTGNCPLPFYYFVGIAATKVLTHFVSMFRGRRSKLISHKNWAE